MKLEKVAIGIAVSCGVLGLLGASNAHADEQMHRMYNPNSGEHFYTANVAEKQHLASVGWKYEGIGWVAPTGDSKGDAVYRLYNRNSGDHHYTLSAVERDWLVKLGWAYEGIGWYSAKPEQGVPLYRLYNPYAKVGTHHYTLALSERNWLVTKGWKAEGIGWYAVKNSSGSNNGSTVSNPIPTPSNDGNYIPDGVTQLGNSGKLFAWAKADEWARAQIADKGSKWYGYSVVLKAVYKDNNLVGFSPDFSKSNSGDSSTKSDDSSTVPDGATKLGNSGKFFKRIDDSNAWADKQVKDASSKFYGRTYYPITVVKGNQPIGYSIEFNDSVNNGGTNSGNSGSNTGINTGANTGVNTGSNTGSTFEFNESEVANEIIRLTNEERNKVGVPEIKSNQVLMDYASMRAEEITRVYSHDRPNGTAGGGTKHIGGETYFIGGENITIVMADNASSNKELALLLYTNWKNSPGHYLNLVNGNTNIIGVGVHKGLYSGKDAYYSCMDVGSYSE